MLCASCRLKYTMLKILLLVLVFRLQNAASLPADPAAVSDPSPNYHYNMERLQNQININQNNVVNIDGILESVKDSVKSADDNTASVESMGNGNADHIIDNIKKEPKKENEEIHPDMNPVKPRDTDVKNEDTEAVKLAVEEKPDVIADQTDKVVEIKKADEGKEPEKEQMDEFKILKHTKTDEEKDVKKDKEDKDDLKRENTQGKKKRAIW